MRPVVGVMHATTGTNPKYGKICNLCIFRSDVRRRNLFMVGIGGQSLVRDPVHNDIYWTLEKDQIKIAIRIKTGILPVLLFLFLHFLL